MKTRNLFVTAAVLAAALSSVSCSKNEPVPTTEGRQLTMTLTLPGDAGTRAVFEENIQDGVFKGLKTKWELGDEISVGVMDNKAISTFKAASVSDDGKTATFVGKTLAEWGELSDGIEFWSCFPSADMDWRQQDGTLANLPNHDFLWIYSEYSDGKLIPETYYTREVYLFRFPEGFAFCDKEVNGNVTLEISGESIYSMFDSSTNESTPATGENVIQVGPVSVSAGALTDDVYVAASTDWGECVKINIGVLPEDGSWVRQYKLSYPNGFNAGQLYTITNVSKLQLLADVQFVDLGLPSGLKWARWNLGATSPEEYGNYYAWGETASKTDYSWATYKWMQEGQSDWKHITKYTFEDGEKEGIWYESDTFIGDGKKSLQDYDNADDAAYAALGGKFRMPTEADWQELYNNCTWTWMTTADGYASNGRLVTASNGNTIFLPAAGYRLGTAGPQSVTAGYYWSSTLSKYSETARYVFFNSEKIIVEGNMRELGFSLRPVCD